MIRCFRIEKMIELSIEDKLNKKQNKNLKNHLKSCEKCKRKYEEELDLKNAIEKELKSDIKFDIPDNFEMSVINQIKEEDSANELPKSDVTIEEKTGIFTKVSKLFANLVTATFFLIIIVIILGPFVGFVANNDYMISSFSNISDEIFKVANVSEELRKSLGTSLVTVYAFFEKNNLFFIMILSVLLIVYFIWSKRKKKID